MRRITLAIVVALFAAGCKKPGPAEPSEADTREAYVQYKKLAEKSRSGHHFWKLAQDSCLSSEKALRVVEDEKVRDNLRRTHKEAVEFETECLKDFEDRQQRAKEMEAKWERPWARLGYSLEPLIE